jgi:hypothetical protein
MPKPEKSTLFPYPYRSIDGGRAVLNAVNGVSRPG